MTGLPRTPVLPLRPWSWAAVLCAAILSWGGAAQAQEATGQEAAGQEAAGQGALPVGTTAPPILTLDQERFFRDSAYGKAAVLRAEKATADLAAENRRIEADLEAEEQDLTNRRAGLDPADFAPLAAAFDTKVEEIRSAQDAKARAITQALEDDRAAFFAAALPVLGQLLADTGAVAILSDQAVILSLTSLDATDLAIARIDAALPAPAAPAP